jgi:hypothetical protein
MSHSKLRDLFYSQSSLGAYQSCQLKFRRRYLEGLFWPGTWGLDQQGREQLEQGRLFHLLAQRYFATGRNPIEGVEVKEPENSWIKDLMQLLPLSKGNLYLPEQELRLRTGSLRLLAKYDLLVFTPQGRVLIYDWKTTAGVPKKEYFTKHLQTLVYRYVLCSAGEACSPFGKVSPEDVTMMYWNPQHPTHLEPLPYSDRQFARDGQLLEELVASIETRDFENFLATTDLKRCSHCEYAPICLGERASQAEIDEEDLELDLNWEEIESAIF